MLGEGRRDERARAQRESRNDMANECALPLEVRCQVCVQLYSCNLNFHVLSPVECRAES